MQGYVSFSKEWNQRQKQPQQRLLHPQELSGKRKFNHRCSLLTLKVQIFCLPCSQSALLHSGSWPNTICIKQLQKSQRNSNLLLFSEYPSSLLTCGETTWLWLSSRNPAILTEEKQKFISNPRPFFLFLREK